MEFSKTKAGCTLHSSLHHPAQREWCTPHLHPSQLVYPVFVTDRPADSAIKGFEPNLQWGYENDYYTLITHLKDLQTKGLASVMLFGVIGDKDDTGSRADCSNGPICKSIRAIRKSLPDLQVLCDVCMCEYTDHGHCGILKIADNEEIIDNEKTLERLADIALSYASAGAHMVCPSDMMDNRIASIRLKLNSHGFSHVSIMAYSSKKSSCMYAPFRDAVESSFKGNRKRYQQPIGSISHAIRAFERDVLEGADSAIVKPCLFYTDIVRELASRKTVPIACYVVSGEYKMLTDYGNSTNSLEAVVHEAHISLLRAGASILITYFTPYLLDKLKEW